MNIEKFFTSNFPSPHTIQKDIEQDGYHVYREAIQLDVYEEVRKYWTEYYRSVPPSRRILRGGFFLGEESFNSYSEVADWKLYRYFDFLWNESPHELTRELALAVHRKRNLAQGFHESFGLEYNSDLDGVYVTVSSYPPDCPDSLLQPESESDAPILYFMLPITLKGKDYDGGGLVYFSKDGEKVDIDQYMNPGSIVFFDGRCRHGIEPIKSAKNSKIGRLSVSAVPTTFEKNTQIQAMIRNSKDSFLSGFEDVAAKTKEQVSRFLKKS